MCLSKWASMVNGFIDARLGDCYAFLRNLTFIFSLMIEKTRFYGSK